MAIDYQEILLDMNRPRKRQSGGLKKILLYGCLLAVLGGIGLAIWRYRLAQEGWKAASGLVGGMWSKNDHSPTDSLAVAATAPDDTAPLRPHPESRPEGSDTPSRVSADAAGLAAPVMTAPATRAVPPEVGTSSLRPDGSATAATAGTAGTGTATASALVAAPAASSAVTHTVAAPAVLSDVRARIRAVDQILASDPAEAMRRLEEILQGRPEPTDAADAGYRLGYAARVLRDEEKAEKSWRETATAHPDSLGGRLSALALADTWFARYAGQRPQVSYWDDIQQWYSQVLGKDDAPFLPDNVKALVKKNLTSLNDAIFFGSGATKLARYHRVESGELLGSIANKYRVDYESIARINGIHPNRIRVGMDLKIIVGEVEIIVRKNSNSDLPPTVTWFLDGRWMREYQSCVGEGDKTPPGTYQLTSKERDPSWTNPLNGQLLSNDHPDNILGSRWMAMKGMNTQGMGIHGTTVDDSVPGYTSAGCVRLLNRDVEELFSFARIGARVIVYE
ncbi:MAG: L,D-transpeptidase family protein [Planctomycetes bacterium]|nr:L,D-transpeptidase family protein [Planctomycetota bacterium]